MVRTSPLSLGPFGGKRVSFAFIGDTLWDIQKPVVPLEVLVNSEQNRFSLLNTGDVPINFGLSIDQRSESYWQPTESYDRIGEDKFILSAVFTRYSEKPPLEMEFNTENWEDVLTIYPKFAGGTQFGIGKQSAGEQVQPGETVSLWFKFMAPASSGGEAANNLQSIRVRIFAAGS